MSRSPPLQTAPKIGLGKSTTRGDWKVTTDKHPILNSNEIQPMNRTSVMSPPEIVFENDGFQMTTKEKFIWTINFKALELIPRVKCSKAPQKMLDRVHEGITV